MQYKIPKIFLVFSIITSLLHSAASSQSIPLNPEYLGLIQQKISSSFIYPQEAVAKGWEGIVKVRFTLAQDGRIKEIDIAESSGYPLLDAAAILAITDASPYPFPKDYTGKNELEVILPIHYVQPKPEPSQISPLEKPLPELTAPQPTPSQRVAYLPPSPEALAPLPEELTSFVDLALKNNQPTKVALQEIELAQIKMLEAKRNFFPAFKLLGYNTTGQVYKVDYEEREAKVQIDQPIFYGGRLIDTFKQAGTNLEITQKNYERLKLDVMQKTEIAYSNLVATKMNLQQKLALYQEAKEIMETINKLAAAEMIIPLEVTRANSWFEQIEFQIDGIKQDLFMAELTFKQVLNTEGAPQVKMQLLEAKRLNLDLDSCLEVAMKTRPEIYLSELLVKFNDYGQKVEASKINAFTVDLSGSYGSYEGHYKTEPWTQSTNWYAGFKVSKPWGASTLNSSYANEETQPRFGQTSPTESSTISAEFALLDNFKRLSDKKRADIDLNRSLSDFNETLKTIAFEVQDAFLNYQKAVLQLNTAQTEMKFRRNELEITKIRAMVGEANISNVMEMLFALSEAQSKYIQALANYHISLANLKKTTGYGLKI